MSNPIRCPKCKQDVNHLEFTFEVDATGYEGSDGVWELTNIDEGIVTTVCPACEAEIAIRIGKYVWV